MVHLSPFVEEPCSSSSSFSFKHDVFLSFRGIDTRYTFTGHLLDALKRANLKTFFDDETIETGRILKPELERGIKESRVSVVVLSKNYASSRWCLDELVLILEQHRTSKQIVIPIFYDVEPSHVKNQKGTFKDAMAEHTQKMKAEKDSKERIRLAKKIDGWIRALTDVGYLKGEDARGRDEKTFIDKIVKDIGRRLQIPIRSTLPQLIGMDGSIHIITSWLKDDSSHTVDILTIMGMGGIGKTSLAEFVYLSHFRDFDTSSYIEDISKTCTNVHNGLRIIQKQLYGHITKTSPNELPIGSLYTSHIEIAVDGKKVFLVLDDVDRIEQLDALLGSKGFHPGSKIIITTRDASLTERCALFKVNAKSKHTQHKLTGLRETESRELLCLHAFMSNDPKEGFAEVLKELVKYCQGHPLALEVLGNSLHNRDVAYWEECLEGLKKESDPDINSVLRKSFDSLRSENDKELFKDIACFFVGMDRDLTQTILKACDINATSGITNLIDRCLLSIGGNDELRMHQLLQEMGRSVVRQESHHKPWERSRLWCHEESFKVLKQKKGTENTRGLTLDMRMLEKISGSYELKTDALSKMDQLKLLQLNYVQMNGSFETFPTELRWLCMHGFSLNFIPSELPMENLVALDLSYSKIKSFGIFYSNPQQLESREKLIGSLKILNLSFCKHLRSLGGFAQLPSLESLILRNCISLVEVSESIAQCVDLVLVDLTYCNKLENCSRTMSMLKKVKTLLLKGCNLGKSRDELKDMDSMEVIPSKKNSLALSLPMTLVRLSLAYNNMSNESFPMDFSRLSMLRDLCLDGNPIVSMPSCVRSLPRLEALSMDDCDMLTSVVRPPRTLTYLTLFNFHMYSINEVVFDPQMSPLGLSTLWNVMAPSLFEFEGIVKIQPMIGVDEKVLHSLGWNNVDFLIGKRVQADSYGVLKETEIQMYYEFGIFSTIYGGEEIPKWVSSHRSEGPPISFTIPSSPNHFRGLNFCYVQTFPVLHQYHYPPTIMIRNKTKNITWIYTHYLKEVGVGGDYCLTLLSHWMFGVNEMEAGDHVSITVSEEDYLWYTQRTKSCGVGFVYDDGEKMDEEEEDALGYYKSWNHIIGGDLSAFQTTTGEYILNIERFMHEQRRQVGKFYSKFVSKGARYKEERVQFRALSRRYSDRLGHEKQGCNKIQGVKPLQRMLGNLNIVCTGIFFNC